MISLQCQVQPPILYSGKNSEGRLSSPVGVLQYNHSAQLAGLLWIFTKTIGGIWDSRTSTHLAYSDSCHPTAQSHTRHGFQPIRCRYWITVLVPSESITAALKADLSISVEQGCFGELTGFQPAEHTVLYNTHSRVNHVQVGRQTFLLLLQASHYSQSADHGIPIQYSTVVLRLVSITPANDLHGILLCSYKENSE